jgi:methylated-DNA-[protein]-cysteine S-methyltransferase
MISPTVMRTAAESPWTVCDSPLGPLTLVGGLHGLRALHYDGEDLDLAPGARRPQALADAVAQLREYFDGERREFDLELDLRGTPFQLRVWRELRRLSYGETITYGELAEAVGRPDIVRAVGGAVGSTPVPIIVPCHRVIGADGALRGYGGGLDRKAALLALERGGAGPGGQLGLI